MNALIPELMTELSEARCAATEPEVKAVNGPAMGAGLPMTEGVERADHLRSMNEELLWSTSH